MNTSQAAFEGITPTRSALQLKVLEYLKTNGPSTDEQMQLGIPMNPSTQRPRRGELVEMGEVVDTGSTRPTRSGCAAIVWRAA